MHQYLGDVTNDGFLITAHGTIVRAAVGYQSASCIEGDTAGHQSEATGVDKHQPDDNPLQGRHNEGKLVDGSVAVADGSC